MEIKILQVFLGEDNLPYKDKERTVHFPIVGAAFKGASNTTKIRFYYDKLVEQDDEDTTTWVAVSKLPNGKIGSKVLESEYDEELGEHYALFELESFYTQYKGDLFISLQGYQGGVQVITDQDTGISQIVGTPTIQATGSIKLAINYATQFIGSGETSNVNFQKILADLGTKLGIRAYTERVTELPTTGQTNVFYAIYDDPNDPNKLNIYVWNAAIQTYIWVGDNTLNLGNYYTQEQGEQFEEEIDNRVSSVENELSSVAQGSPKGVYATLSDLESAYPTGTTGIYVVSANGHWYYWNGSAWADGGVYLSQLADDFLDENSSNPVKNSALFGILGKYFTDFALTVGAYINSVGLIDELSFCSYSSYIELDNANYVYAYFLANTAVAYYDTNKNFISSYVFSENYTGFYKLNPPSGAVYFRFSNRNNGVPDENVKIVYINCQQALRQIEKIKNEIPFSKKIGINFTAGYIQSFDGEQVEGAPWYSSDFIEVKGAFSIYNSMADAAAIAYYDEDKQFISSLTAVTLTASEKQLTIPANAKYVRFSNLSSTLTNSDTYIKYYTDERLDNIENYITYLLGKSLNDETFDEKPVLINGGYINSSNGEVYDGETFSYSGFIDCSSIYSVYTSLVQAASICYYDEGKNYISSITNPSGSSPKEYILENPVNAKYIRLCNFTNSLPNTSVVIKYKLVDFIWSQQKEINKIEEQTNNFEEKSNNILSAFSNITCIGDSLTYSQVYTSDNDSRQAYNPYPKCIEKRTGTTTVGLATAGATPITWWSRWSGDLANKTNQLAIIYLGTNAGLTDTLSTDAPENTPYSQWAETNTGVYAKIVARCQELGMKVLLLKIWATSGSMGVATTNNVIDQIGVRFGCAVCNAITLTDLKYHYFPDLTGYDVVHYNDLGYSAFADVLIKEIGKLDNNQMKFIIPQ